MVSLGYILKISFYVVYIFIAILLSKGRAGKGIVRSCTIHHGKIVFSQTHKQKHMSLGHMCVLSVLLGVYSVIVSLKPYTSDRGYYALTYGNSEFRYQLPLGFAAMSDVLYVISTNPDFLFFFCSFIMMLIVLWEYREHELSNKAGLLLLLSSLYFIYGFHLLKQGIAVAIGTVALSYGLKKRYTIAILLCLLAATFHESALVIIPILLLLNWPEKRWKRNLIYAGSAVIVVFFGIIASRLFSFLTSTFSVFERELSAYDFSNLGVSMEGIITAVKGVPVYFITIIAIKYRKEISTKIKDYDKYLLLTLVMTSANLLSAYMYWMYRFGLFVSFFVYMFFGKIIECLPKTKKRILYYMVVYGTTFILTIRYLGQIFFNYGGF